MGKGKHPRLTLRHRGLRSGVPRWEYDDNPTRRAFVSLGISPFHWVDQILTDPGPGKRHQAGMFEPDFDPSDDSRPYRFAEEPIERTQAWAIFMQQTGRMG